MPVPSQAETFTVTGLANRVRKMAARSSRTIIGIAGPPGAGKSTVATALVRELGPAAVLVPLDGFHLSNQVLQSLGRHGRKGAPDTFDAPGYVAMLRRLRQPCADVVYAPVFRREIEEPIGSSIPVPPDVPIVITEGNYLLLDSHPWRQVRGLLDAVWYLEVDDTVRVGQLIARHMEFGKTPDAARTWAEGSDRRNGDIVAASAHLADLVLRL